MAQGRRKNLNSVLVKPAGPDCSLACAYCFYRGKAGLFPGAGPHRMSHEILDRMVQQVMAQQVESVSFSWQGGEPTIAGLAFYQKAVDCQERYGAGKTVGNGIQTSGINVDKEWANFFRTYHFLVGISIDGPEHVHDRYRHTAGGAGTWRTARNAAQLLLDAGVSVNALSVINDYSAQFPEEIYRHLKGLGLRYMQFIPCVETNPDDPSAAADYSVDGEQFGSFLCKIFDLWIADFKRGAPTTSVRFFESLLFGYAGLAPAECTLSAECGSYVAVEHNGDVYACDFFVDRQWRLGNLMEEDLVRLLNSPKQNEFGKMKAGLPAQCRECEWLWICRGGCTKDRIRDPRDKGLSHFCKAYKFFFRHAGGRLRKLADEWKRGQREEQNK